MTSSITPEVIKIGDCGGLKQPVVSAAAAVPKVPGGPDRTETMRLLAAEVLPAVRELVPAGV